MKFTKMCGTGNDFVVIENFDGAISRAELPELARRLCRRRFCVGADGLMIETHNDPAKAKSDGAQSLTPDQFDDLMKTIKPELEFFGKTLT